MTRPLFTEPRFTENVIPQLLAWRRAGHKAALVTLVGIDGSGPRPLGSQMAVNANGEAAGMISSGCAEAAVVAEAQAAIEHGHPRTVRYGAGSRYIDIVLPCGTGIDVHFDPTIEIGVLERLDGAIKARIPAKLAIDPGGQVPVFERRYDPRPRLLIAGRGPILSYVVRNAGMLEWECVVASPGQQLLDAVRAGAMATYHLTKPEDLDPTPLVDLATAVVLLFHDHEWEPPILAQCEHTLAFYIGALGSRKSHAQRCELLRARGCSEEFITRIRSPIGLAIGGKSPPEIALAIVAEIASLAPFDPVAKIVPS